MDTRIGEGPPLKSDDLGGWQQAIADNRLKTFRLEAIAAAFQDLGQRDIQVRNALAKHLSDSILRMLRKCVGVIIRTRERTSFCGSMARFLQRCSGRHQPTAATSVTLSDLGCCFG